jgi:hypothetical protein
MRSGTLETQLSKSLQMMEMAKLPEEGRLVFRRRSHSPEFFSNAGE